MAAKDNAVLASGADEFTENISDMIIQCPKCKTKFSVSSELIAGYDLPRFHCSRCDNVFDLDAKPELTIESRDAEPAAEIKPVEPPPAAAESTGKFTSPYFPPPPVASSDDDDDDDFLSAIKAAPGESRSLQIPKNFDAKLPPDAPHESPPAKKPAGDPTEQIAFTFPTPPTPPKPESMPEEEEEGMSFPAAFGKSAKSDFTLVTPNFSVKNQTPPVSPRTQNPADFAPAAVTSEFPGVGISIPEPLPTRVGPWRSFFMIAAPMLVLVLALAGLSFYLVRSPSFAHAFVHSISSSTPRFPPAAVHLTNLRFKKVALDSGQVVHTISGTLRNNSKESFGEVVLLGLAFSKDGHVLAQTKVNAGSTLADTRVKSLPLDMLRDLQNAAPAKKYELLPGKDQDFTIALIDGTAKGDISKAAYFSAMVHSVRN